MPPLTLLSFYSMVISLGIYDDFRGLSKTLFLLTGTIIVGLATYLTHTIDYICPALTRGTTTALTHVSSPPLETYPFFLLVSLKLSLCDILQSSLELVSIGLSLHLLGLTYVIGKILPIITLRRLKLLT